MLTNQWHMSYYTCAMNVYFWFSYCLSRAR